jgi:hypothetical protein
MCRAFLSCWTGRQSEPAGVRIALIDKQHGLSLTLNDAHMQPGGDVQEGAGALALDSPSMGFWICRGSACAPRSKMKHKQANELARWLGAHLLAARGLRSGLEVGPNAPASPARARWACA